MKSFGNYYWPDEDNISPPLVLAEVERLPQYLRHVKSFRTCIQAGGNCGVFAQALASSFQTIITVEPDPQNMECLRRNATAGNIVAHHAALGDAPGYMQTFRQPTQENNFGATMVQRSETGVPTLIIDDAGLNSVDFIMLDIEGFELQAMRGAEQTILRCRPVIAAEVKGLGKVHGYTNEMLHDWLDGRGYSMAEAIGKDRIYTP